MVGEARVQAYRALTASLVVALACGDATGPAQSTFVQVSAGAFHACGLTADGSAWCWGANTYGALGNGSTASSSLPVRVAGSLRFTIIAAGLHHTCALARNGGAWCWGINLSGQLGNGSVVSRSVPVAVVSSSAWQSVTTGEGHSCATTAAGTSCWGAALGPAADGTVHDPISVPTPLGGTPLQQVSVGYEIACALTASGAAKCWGLQPPGVVLTNGKRATDTPTLVTSSPVLASISAGHKHTCGLDVAGAAWCWGLNESSQVGDGTTDTAFVPVRVSGGHTFVAIAAHAPGHTCALDGAGAGWCWGANTYGQLGDSSQAPRAEPTAVAGGLSFTAISVGFHFTCGISDGRAYCWGYGGLGQLGNGTTSDRVMPAGVTLP